MVMATRAESHGTSEKRMTMNEVSQFGSATACVRSAESFIRDKLLGRVSLESESEVKLSKRRA